MLQDDFVEEEECRLTRLGRLHVPVAIDLYDLCCNLMKEVVSCKCCPEDQCRLNAAAATMAYCSATLLCTSQTFPNVLQTVTSTQRHYLETLAVLSKVWISDCYVCTILLL